MTSATTDVIGGLGGNLALKAPVRAVATSNITLSGEQTVGGTACVVGDRVLCIAETSSVDNGIWVVSTGSWTRARDFDGSRDVVQGTLVSIADGTAVYRLTTATPVIGTSSLAFTRWFGAGGDGTAEYSTVAAVEADEIASSVGAIRTQGYIAAGDSGGALYKRVVSEPAHSGKLQSADGAWWEIAEDILHVRQFGAKNDNATPASTAINAALAAALALGIGKVSISGGGTFLLDAYVAMQAGISLVGDGYTTLKQANNVNLGGVIDWGSAHYAKLENCIVDGNRANNTASSDVGACHTRLATNAVVRNCRIKNMYGFGIVSSNATYAKFIDNEITDCYFHGIFIVGAGETFSIITGNRIIRSARGGMLIGAAGHSIISDNTIIGYLIGNSGSLVVNTSGSTVTWVSGTKFGGLVPGVALTVNNGQEFVVTSIPDDETLIVSGTLPTLTGAAAGVGTGDGIGIGASSYCNVSRNTVRQVVSFGIVTSIGGSASSCNHNNIHDNIVTYTGKTGIVIGYDSGAGAVWGNSVVGNTLEECGRGGGVEPNLDRAGIVVFNGSTPDKVSGTFIADNAISSGAGTGQTSYWLACDADAGIGSVILGRNMAFGVLNGNVVYNDVKDAEIDAGWGSAATTTDIVSTGDAVAFRITCTGAGQASYPLIVISKVCDTSDTPMLRCSIVTGAAVADMRYGMIGEQASTRGVWRAQLATTPVADDMFYFHMK